MKAVRQISPTLRMATTPTSETATASTDAELAVLKRLSISLQPPATHAAEDLILRSHDRGEHRSSARMEGSREV